jgi:aspartokinase
VLLCVLQVFSEHDLPIHGMTSSLSALCINTDYDLLDRAADLLLKVFDLPEDHSPFRYQPSTLDSALHQHQPGRKVETVASYWEPVIRIYGSNLKTGLAMFNIYFAKKQLAQIGSLLSEVKGLDSFEMMTLSQSGSDDFCLVLLIKPTGGQQEELSIRNCMEVPGVVFSERSAVEVLYFHGPHFQDRYGVMDTAVKALKKNETEIHAANCSGTSVYLVTGDTIGGRALDALAEVFVVPKTY